MSNCYNHPEIEALSICHNCKNEFCEDCLVEGTEYYYCMNPECQEKFNNEFPKFIVPENVICPNCENELELNDEERLSDKNRCPICDTVANYTIDPPKIYENQNYIDLLSSINSGDISLIKSILDDGNIDYNLQNENFHSIRPLLEPVKFLVNENDFESAKELLKDYDLKIFGLSKRHD